MMFRPLDYTMVFFLHYDMLKTKCEIRYILSIPVDDCNVSRDKLQYVYRKATNRIKSFSIDLEHPRKFESIFLFLAV